MTPMKLLGHAQFHGANRLADKTSRWIWAPALLILLGSAITLVMMTVKRYQDNPTYMVQIDSVFSVKKFPAVVLCPEIKFVEEKMDDFVAKVQYPPGMNSTKIREILPQLAAFYSLDVPYVLTDLLQIEHLLDYNGLTVETAGEILTATCEETMLREMLEHGRDIEGTQQQHHQYTKWFGYTSGLMLAVNQSQKLTVVDISYKWVATLPSQYYVDISMNGTALNPGSEHWIAFYSKGYQIGVGAKSLRPTLRKCYMSSDKLRYFPMYGKEFCTLEEEMANTLSKCKCVRVNHPIPPGTSVCRAAMLQCSAQALIAIDSGSTACPMACDFEKTYVIASNYKLDDSVRTVEPFYKGLNFEKVSVVRVFIQRRKRPTLERWSYFDYLDLFSQIGGMFSVFFGCSILTLLGLLQLAWHVIVKQCQRRRN
ncbi:hypothetical protein PYW07_015689 [Mythimna separata]|uniref:Uncharacterized protein n=1 Tax=Mythimna separata TaxID=271217 RepID=A0AAD7YRR3_MYTSE|nr:hypothetical protein PYW07_015689 [Mythimna separata]